MIDLYRAEADTQLAALSQSLLDLEQSGEGDPAKRYEPMMRAAHSLKGAARIVGLDAAVKLTHAMEDVFETARTGKLILAPEAVDVLLQTVDALMAMSKADEKEIQQWAVTHEEAFQRILADMEAIRQGRYDSVKDSPPLEPPASDLAEVPAPVTQPEPEPEPEAPPAVAAPAPESGSSVVRVSAENLNRLMGLAAESLVETRRFEVLRQSVESLKQIQRALSRHLDQVETQLDEARLAEGTPLLLEQARSVNSELLGELRRQADVFDHHARNSTLLADRLYREVLASRMRPFSDGVQGFPRLVRDLARRLNKQISLVIEGRDVPVDRDVLERLEAPLNHILRNACDHGMELPEERAAAGKPPKGTIRLEARHSAGMLVLRVMDDGRGVNLARIREKILERQLTDDTTLATLSDEEVLEFLFLPGFSTAAAVTEVSGRGVGLDVVQTLMHELGGSVRIQSQPGKGTTFILQMPITRSVIRALRVSLDHDDYAFPLTRLRRTLMLDPGNVKTVEGRQYFDLDGEKIGLISAREALGFEAVKLVGQEATPVVVIGEPGTSYALEVDALLGESDLVVRTLDPRLGKVPGINAASLNEEGGPVLIVDVDDLLQAVDKLLAGGRLGRRNQRRVEALSVKKHILVVDDSLTVRETEKQILRNAGYQVDTAVDGMDGWNNLRLGDYHLVVSDVDMPRLNGFELVKKIRADARLGRLPVIMVSYKDREEDRLRGMEAGADTYLTKSSFQDDTFIRAVSDLIGAPEERA